MKKPKQKRRADPGASERMKAYWKAKRAKEAEVIEPEEIAEVLKREEVEPDPHVAKSPLALEPEPEILTPTEREEFDAIMAQIVAAPHNGAKEAIIDANRSRILSGMKQGWGPQHKEKE